MVKKEIAEIKKTLRPESNSFTMLCGCYVHGEDRERTTFKTAFQSLQEEDFFKYLDVFKKTLSGSIGKTLFNVPLSREQQELQELLYELVTGGCKDDNKLNEFYERVTGAIETQENFVIFLAHNRYDIPGKTSDDLEMDDASEEVFSYILCAVCPVSLTEPGLGYSEECGTFESMVRNWTAHKPDYGFLFPAFNDRSADIHEMLFYNRSVKSLGDQAVLNFTGNGLPMAAEEQKDAVCKIAENLFQGELDYSMAMAVKEQIDQTIEERADMERAEETELDKEKLKDLLERATGQPISDAEFNHAAHGVLDEGEKLCYENLSDTRTLELKTPTVTVKVKTNETGTPEVRKIDGRNCIVIPVEGELTVNGMKVETTKIE